MTLTTQHESDEADIRRRIDGLVEAIRNMDLDRVMPIYAPDIVSFDVQPPLQHVGAAAKSKHWIDVFTTYRHPLGYEVRDLTLTVGVDMAFAHGMNRLSGTLKSGQATKGIWVRWTACFRKIDGEWLIVHDQVSTPLDFQSGKTLTKLEP